MIQSVDFQIKPVSYLMLNADTVLHTSAESRLSVIPVGTSMHFTVTYHDDVGEQFFATNTALKYRASRYDMSKCIAFILNFTIYIKMSLREIKRCDMTVFIAILGGVSSRRKAGVTTQ